MTLQFSARVLGGCATALLLLFFLLPSVAAASCASFGFGYNEYPSDDPRVHMFGDGHSKVPNTSLRSVSYRFVAKNDDTGYKRIYQGTDRTVDGEWNRAVSPKVGFGSLVFKYQILKAKLENGDSCAKSTVTLTDQR